MKRNIFNILMAIVVILPAVSCTKHDPFDFVDPNPWILSKFAKTNAIDFEDNNVTFFESNAAHAAPQWYYNSFCHLPEADTKAYYSYDDLKRDGLLDRAVPDGRGGYYRMPTLGELEMILPGQRDDNDFWGVLDFFGMENNPLFMMEEEAFLDNNDDSSINRGGRSVKGESSFYAAVDYPDDEPDFNPVFALRFKGTSQYAAYRYDIIRLRGEMVQGDGYESEWELWAMRLRAVRLSPDADVDFEDIMNEDYFNSSGAIELVLPMLGLMASSNQGEQDRLYDESYGTSGSLLSSTVGDAGQSAYLHFSTGGTAVAREGDTYGTHMQYPIRPLKCKSDGTL